MTPLIEIHHVDVKGGDGTVILVKDQDAAGAVVFSVLIDAGVARGGLRLKQYVAGLGLTNPFDVLIASHYHDDHMAGIVPCDFNFKQLVDIGGYTSTAEPTRFDPVNGTGLGNSTPTYIGLYRRYVAGRMAGGSTRLPIPFLDKANWTATESGALLPNAVKMTPLEIPLGASGITLRCYCAGGVVPIGTADAAQNVAKVQKDGKGRALDPNDLSLAWLLQWGDFSYLTSGDLSGDPDKTAYYFLEKALLDALTGTGGPLAGKTLTVLKAPHHGSERSTYDKIDDTTPGFLARLQPDAIIVSCNTSKQVPHPAFLQRVTDHCAGRAKKPAVLFVSDMYYAPSSDRTPLVAGLAAAGVTPAENVVTEADGSVQNLATSALVVKRYAGGALPAEAQPAADATVFRDGYRIQILTGRVTKDSKEVVARGVNYVWKFAIPASFATSIRLGFQALAADMIKWRTADGTADPAPGLDYIRACYPAIGLLLGADPTTTAAAIITQLQGYFDAQYTLASPTAPNYSVGSDSDRSLTMDERETLYNALVRNRYQFLLNSRVNPNFMRLASVAEWNPVTADPHYVPPPPPPQGTTSRKRKALAISNL